MCKRSTSEQRLSKAEELLSRDLSQAQKEAILAAHEIGASGEGKFTRAELLERRGFWMRLALLKRKDGC